MRRGEEEAGQLEERRNKRLKWREALQPLGPRSSYRCFMLSPVIINLLTSPCRNNMLTSRAARPHSHRAE